MLALTVFLCFSYSTMNIIASIMGLLDHNQSTSTYVHSFNLIVRVNNNGTSSILFWVFGVCVCNLFFKALGFIQSNTVINIISPVVSLDIFVHIQRVSNITITSNDDATIICHRVGSLHFSTCSNVIIEAVTWDHCGDVNYPNIPGIRFL